MLAYADGYREETGATGRFDVVAMPFVPSSPAFPGYDKARLVDHIAELRDLGVVGIAVHAPAATRAGVIDRIAEFGSEIIAAVG